MRVYRSSSSSHTLILYDLRNYKFLLGGIKSAILARSAKSWESGGYCSRVKAGKPVVCCRADINLRLLHVWCLWGVRVCMCGVLCVHVVCACVV